MEPPKGAARMAYDPVLAGRIGRLLSAQPGVKERAMFGGVCFMVRGHMCCGVAGKQLMVRVGPEAYAAALRLPHARPMDFTGKPLKGFIFVQPAGTKGAGLKRWVDRGVGFVSSLPPKNG